MTQLVNVVFTILYFLGDKLLLFLLLKLLILLEYKPDFSLNKIQALAETFSRNYVEHYHA